GDRMHADQASVAQTREIAPLLLGSAVRPDRYDAGEKMRAQREEKPSVAAPVAERPESDRPRQGIKAAAAVFFRHRQPLNADTGALSPQLARKRLFAIACGCAFVKLALRELDDVVAQQ